MRSLASLRDDGHAGFGRGRFLLAARARFIIQCRTLVEIPLELSGKQSRMLRVSITGRLQLTLQSGSKKLTAGSLERAFRRATACSSLKSFMRLGEISPSHQN